MKEKILQALNAKGIKTDGLNDEQLLAAFNEQAAKEAIEKKKGKEEKDEQGKEGKEKTTNAQVPEWFANFVTTVNNRFDEMSKVVNKSVEAEEKTMREAVKTAFDMSETVVNELKGEPLKALYAKCQKSVSVNGAFNTANGNQSICDMPE